MLSGFFNHASMHPVKTALMGGALILAAPLIAPYLAPVIGASLVPAVASLGNILGIGGVVAGGANMAVNATRNIGPAFNNASGAKVALGGFGLGVLTPYVAPFLGTLGAPTMAFAAAAAPWVILLGVGLIAAKKIGPLFSPAAPRMAAPPVMQTTPQHP